MINKNSSYRSFLSFSALFRATKVIMKRVSQTNNFFIQRKLHVTTREPISDVYLVYMYYRMTYVKLKCYVSRVLFIYAK